MDEPKLYMVIATNIYRIARIIRDPITKEEWKDLKTREDAETKRRQFTDVHRKPHGQDYDVVEYTESTFAAVVRMKGIQP